MHARPAILEGAEHVFDEHGFAGSGMDGVSAAVGVSIRTLYKHVGSKDQLVEAVLGARRERFLAQSLTTGVRELFASLERWVSEEGARGCLFLRAEGENGGRVPAISEMVDGYHRDLTTLVADSVRASIGHDDAVLAEQILILFEGATSAASYRGVEAVRVASAAAATLLAAAAHGTTA